MTEAKKTPVKRSTKAVEPSEQVQQYRMPQDVKNWIEQAESRLRHLGSEVARLKEENSNLKRDNRMMQQRVLGSSNE